MRKVYAKMVLKTSLRNKKITGKTFTLTSWNESQNNQMCLKMSSHVMKRVFFNTIQKHRGNQCTGRTHFTENKKKKNKNEQVENEGNDYHLL
jgi:hypothetical protein